MTFAEINKLALEIEDGLAELKSEMGALPAKLDRAITQSDAGEIRKIKARQREIADAYLDFVTTSQAKIKTAIEAHRKPSDERLQAAEGELARSTTNLESIRAEYAKAEAALLAEVHERERALNETRMDLSNEHGRLSRLMFALQDELKAAAAAV